MACYVILVARQRISCLYIVNNGKERDTTLLMRPLATKMTPHAEVFSCNALNQTVSDGVAHSKNPRKCAYHVTFDLDLDLEHTLDAC